MGTLSHIIDDGLLLNFDASSGYLPINLSNVLISFHAEKSWLKSLSAGMECLKKSCHDYRKPDCIFSAVRCTYHKLGAVGIFPDKSGKLTISKSNTSLLSKIEQTRSPFDRSISKSKYDTTFLDSDVSETTSSYL